MLTRVRRTLHANLRHTGQEQGDGGPGVARSGTESPTGEVIQSWVSPELAARAQKRNRPIQIKRFEV